MLSMYAWFKARFTDETGASMVEYALLVVLIAIVAIVAVTLTGTEVSETFEKIGTELDKQG